MPSFRLALWSWTGNHFWTWWSRDVGGKAATVLWGFATEIWGRIQEEFACECARGLSRHLISPPYDRKLNLMHDTAFQGTNQVFYGLIRTLKQQGLDRIVHKSALTQADFKKLYSCGILDTNNPVTLQNKVFVEVNLHFCRRGREGLRELNKDSFVKKSDSNGRTYITLGFNELEKNHQGFDKRDYQEEPRMYEHGGDQCPVKSFDLYVSKLHPECRAFFQRPSEKFSGKETWFVNCPVGKNTLA